LTLSITRRRLNRCLEGVVDVLRLAFVFPDTDGFKIQVEITEELQLIAGVAFLPI